MRDHCSILEEEESKPKKKLKTLIDLQPSEAGVAY